jgi:DNA-binding IclR family transcriptional regulator
MILTELAKSGDWLGVRELSRRTGINASTAHHLIKTLLAHGYVENDAATGRYRLGVAAVMMGSNCVSFQRLADAAKPRLDALFEEIGEVLVGLVVRNGSFVTNYWRQNSQGVVFSREPGEAVPQPHLMACGCLLLLGSPPRLFGLYQRDGPLPGFRRASPFLEVRGVLRNARFQWHGAYAIGVDVLGLSGAPVMSVGWSMDNSLPMKRASPMSASACWRRLMIFRPSCAWSG